MAKNSVEVLPTDKHASRRIFQQLSVTSRSLMGTLILEAGGIFVDSGWLRFLASGSSKLSKTVLDWNSSELGMEKAFIVAYDVLGGFFAINGGAFPGGGRNEIFYWQPDVLQWVNMKGSYSQLFSWALTGNLDQFYKNMRWPGWQHEVKQLTGDQGFSILPFLWIKSNTPLAERSKRIVPIEELWHLGQDLGKYVKNAQPRSSLQIL